MNSFETKTLEDGQFFTDQLVLDPKFVLLDSSIPFSESLKKALIEWNFKVVYSNGNITGTGPKVEVDLSKFESVDDFIEEPKKEKTVSAELNQYFRQTISDAAKHIKANPSISPMEDVEKVYEEAMKYIDATYTRFATHKTLNIKDLSDAVRDFCNFLQEYKKYVLRITPKVKENDKNFIVSHSLRSTMFALTIGLQINMPVSNLIELGVACIVHEIGQIRLPPQLYLTDRMLSPQEMAKLMTHTILSYNILKENNFPLSIQLGVLEHHERENGRGYPRHIDGTKTSLYGKILAVACSFEAISAPRRYKAAKSTYEAMIEMLSNKDKQYNEIVIKALVQALSLFPIGAYVYLSNGKIAQVTEANNSDPRTPIVQILGEKNEAGNPRTVQTDMQNFRIVRVLSKDELEAVLKSLAGR
ncbi:MAG: HD domain-containing protein [Treponema sp.]|nr:HD domain-containing protein [Treponema sp.]